MKDFSCTACRKKLDVKGGRDSMKLLKINIKKISSCCLSIILAVMLAVPYSFTSVKMYAEAARTLTVSQAVALGFSNSSSYRKTKSKIALQQVKYTQAVKSIQLKKKNMTTFRYSPLLSFKFPEKPLLSDEYEWTFKPIQIQSEIAKLNHELTDIKYSVKEEVSNQFVEVYTLQEKITFKTEEISELNKSLKTNQLRLYEGLAKQSDIDSIEKSIESAETALGNYERSFESAKEKLSDLINLDVMSGYTFSNPYLDQTISRDNLDSIIEYTLDNSQSYYEAKLTTKLALTSINTNYNLMKNQYGSDMSIISSYINSVKKGEKINTDAFKAAYDSFLDKIDSYWNGKFKILFIKIPKEWFKSDTDGIRYVEDDPYILYTDSLEYMEALSDQESLKKEITSNVKSGFDNVIVLKNSYDSLQRQTDTLKAEVEKEKVQNKLGELSMEEYQETEKSYKEVQIEALEALALYTQTLNSFDRLTCGAVTNLLKGASISLNASSSGVSNSDDDESGQITYDFVSKVEDSIFELTINVPEGYSPEVTDFELWVDNVQVGEKTSADGSLRHLSLSTDGADKVIIRLYNGDSFVADCEIDPYDYHGVLYIDGGGVASEDEKTQEEAAASRTVATYSYTVNKNTGIVTIKIKPEITENIAYFTIVSSEGTPLGSGELVSVNDSFKYLSVLAAYSLADVNVVFYDSDQNELYVGVFDEIGMSVEVNDYG
jgi:hypothetical protein